MQMSTTSLAFTQDNFLNSSLHPLVHSSPAYTTTTTSGFRGRKVTALKINGFLYSTAIGAINWREKKFEIRGTKKSWSDLKSKNGLFSR